MTLITAVLSRDWIMLAADRRLTSRDASGRVLWQTDVDTKIAVVDGELLVGYTGVIANPEEGTGFGAWLADVLTPLRSGPVVPYLKDTLTRLWRESAALRGERFMLVTVGFTADTFGRVGPPEINLISNSMTRDGDFSPFVTVAPEFDVYRITAKDGYCVVTQGVQLEDHEVGEHVAGLRLTDGHIEFADLSAMITKLHHYAAENSNGEVGASSLQVFMNKSAHPSQNIVTKIGDLAFGVGGGVAPDGTAKGDADFATDIVAVFVDPTPGNTDYYPPASVGTQRFPGKYWTTRTGLIRVGGDPAGMDQLPMLPVAGPITSLDPGVPFEPHS